MFRDNFDLLLPIIKRKLYSNSFIDIDFWLKELRIVCWNDLENGQEQLANFLIELKPNIELKKVYEWLSGEIRSKDKFKKLKDTYSDEIEVIFSTWTR
jgi:hypothetical protein